MIPSTFNNRVAGIHTSSTSQHYARLALPLLLAGLFVLDPSVQSVIMSSLADAYINVGVFVAVTLFAYHAAERYFGLDIRKLEDKPPLLQITVAALLGALPGCGGAIVVVSQYAAGHMRFAAVVAVLVSTMGDAAFLLLAKSPQTGMLVIGTGIVAGVLSGLLVNAIHSPNFLRRPVSDQAGCNKCMTLQPIPRSQQWLWLALLAMVFPLTLLSAFQVELSAITLFGITLEIDLTLGVAAAVLCILMWALLPLRSSYRGFVAEDTVAQQNDAEQTASKDTAESELLARRVIHDTNFIMVWVAVAFLLFELSVHYTGISLEALFQGAAWTAPLIGVAVGLLPGCGPQIIIASLYLQGIAPLSTLLGNAISNDGDALFPAIALTPKAALLATAYSSVPALLVAYLTYYYWEA